MPNYDYDDPNKYDGSEDRLAVSSRSRTADPDYREKIEAYRRDALSELGATRIGQQIAELHDQLAKTNAIFSELKTRIEPILMPETDMEKAMASDGETRIKSSEISESLYDLRRVIGNLQRRIGETIERVQL